MSGGLELGGDTPSHAGLTFRRAVIADVANIVPLVESSYRGDESRCGWTTEADLLDGQRTDDEEVTALIESLDSTIWLGYSQGSLVASVLLSRGARVLYLGMFAVRPELQGRGIGRTVLALAERVARADGLGFIEMHVLQQRAELIGWYERCGFAVTGERKPFPYGDPRFGLPRRSDLSFEVLRKAVPRS